MHRAAAVLAILTSTACASSSPERTSAEAAVPVVVDRVALHPIARVLEAGGVIQAQTTAVMTSRIVAPVLSVHAAAGDRVRAGQVLVRLDARDLDAQQRRASASADALALGAKAAVAERQGAEAALVLARATHGRIAALHGRRSATPQELDEAVAALAGAEARLQAAHARVAEAEAALAAARSGAAAASVAASFAAITAPFDGVVAEKLVEPGNLAAPGTPLLRLEDARAFRLEVRIDSSRGAQVVAGTDVEVLLDPDPELGGAGAVTGRVLEVARSVDAGSQSFLVKIALPPAAPVRSGTFARVRIKGTAHQALAIPLAAIVTRGQLPTVFVVQDARARMRVISTGEQEDARVEVLAGLADGESVILDPRLDLQDGDAVSPRRARDGGR